MRRHFFLIFLILSAITANASLRFDDASLPPVEIPVSASTGLDGLYVVHSVGGITATYTATSASTQVTVERFGIRGASFPEAVDPSSITRNGASVTLSGLTADCGYIFTEPSKVSYYWITDYSAHPYSITELFTSAEQECDRAYLSTSGSAPRMVYYSITGRGFEIDRQIRLSYTTLTPDDQEARFNSAEMDLNLPYIDGAISLTPPLCDTYFTLSCDRFLRQWGQESEITSTRYNATSVSAVTTARQTSRQVDNELKVDAALGGSAPVEIEFSAAVSDAAVYTQWLMARDEDMEDVFYRTSDLDFTYTFTEMGNAYVRFEAADASGRCEYFGDTYTVYIGESYLRCPNAFSPGASEGVNDEWKVSYKSIIDFECYIFNRWGEKMAEFHDPAGGWDGKYGGKVVPAGVYYYVIKARGSDGKKYNLSGDINILRYSE